MPQGKKNPKILHAQIAPGQFNKSNVLAVLFQPQKVIIIFFFFAN